MISRILIFSILIHCFTSVLAQNGGESAYSFLNLTSSARVASLGGNNISLNDNDLNMPFYNPSLLNHAMSNNIVLNYSMYIAGINYGNIGYAKTIENIGNFAAGINYINYGNFTETDATGAITGNFTSADYCLNLLYSSMFLDSMFSYGANLKTVYSQMYSLSSVGLLADAGITYHNKPLQLDAALVIKNAGVQIKPYSEGNRESVPFDIQIGVSQKIKHAPFRVSLTLHSLLDADLTYKVKTSDTIQDINSKPAFLTFSDKFMRHLIIGVEFIPTKNIYLNLGYNHRRRQELKIDTRPFLTGFSWGFGFKVSKFRLSYSRSTYHLAAATNNFSLSVNLSDFFKKSETAGN